MASQCRDEMMVAAKTPRASILFVLTVAETTRAASDDGHLGPRYARDSDIRFDCS